MIRPEVALVGHLHDGDPLEYLLAGDVSTDRLADAHAIFQRTVDALREAGHELDDVDRYTREALGVDTFVEANRHPDYPKILRENYERLVHATSRWVVVR